MHLGSSQIASKGQIEKKDIASERTRIERIAFIPLQIFTMP